MMTAKDSADNLFSTAWPVGTLLASSWDTSLVKKVGAAFGNEIKEYGIDFILGPGVNIHRNPLEEEISNTILKIHWSREKWRLPSSMEFNRREWELRSNILQQTTRRRTGKSVNTIVSERGLREIYLKNFEIAIKNSQPWAVMSSYNLINGTYTSESHDLITTILKDEWGFKGFVMTDWFGGKDAVAQMKAGNNLIMPGTTAQVKADH